MVQIDVPIAFGIGSLFADAARRQLKIGRAEYCYRAFYRNNIYQLFFFSWIPVYFLVNYFGWETTHMWWHEDSVTDYPYFLPIFMVVFFLAANGGLWLGRWFVINNRLWTNRGVYLGILIYSGIWIFAQPGRTFRLGTYDNWKTDGSPWFWGDERLWQANHAPLSWTDTTFVYMLIFTLVLWAIPLIYFYRSFRQEGSHLDPRNSDVMAELPGLSKRERHGPG